jgi:hypothetical protein
MSPRIEENYMNDSIFVSSRHHGIRRYRIATYKHKIVINDSHIPLGAISSYSRGLDSLYMTLLKVIVPNTIIFYIIGDNTKQYIIATIISVIMFGLYFHLRKNTYYVKVLLNNGTKLFIKNTDLDYIKQIHNEIDKVFSSKENMKWSLYAEVKCGATHR